ncbi:MULTISPECIES: hypothetical protein [Streptacidiphilus]|uniref:LPXTG cell wall anchor domain-containing protein n=1 Tax=Streptacidiphilus cavernicola TaxID=3342716 RepID=A0ABV6V016_9ACTN|nr:hypothetical protein [Streptacidiphilus jeojiense]
MLSSDLAIHGLGTLPWAALIMALMGLVVRLVRRHPHQEAAEPA